MRAIWKWCRGARLPQRILGGEQVWESSLDFGDLKQHVRVRAAYAKTGLALSSWGCLVRYGSLRKCLISLDFHPGQFFSSSFSPINETIKRVLMRMRTSCSSAVPHQRASPSSSVWEWIAVLNSAQHGGENQKNQPSHCSQDGILWHFVFVSRGTGFGRGAPSSEPFVTKRSAQDPYFRASEKKIRKDKAAMQSPQRCVASFLMGWLSNATKSSLPEGLCSLKLLRVHPLGGGQVKKTWSGLGCSLKQPKSSPICYMSKPKTKSGEEPTGLASKPDLSEVATTVQVLSCCSIKRSTCVQLLTQTIASFFLLQNQHAVSQTFELFLSVFLGNVHSFE